MQILPEIVSVGPVSSKPRVTDSKSTTDFLIEVEMADGSRGLLPLSRDAVSVLAEELSKWLQARGSR